MFIWTPCIINLMIILYQETWVFYQLTKTGEGKDSEEKREEKPVEKVNFLLLLPSIYYNLQPANIPGIFRGKKSDFEKKLFFV